MNARPSVASPRPRWVRPARAVRIVRFDGQPFCDDCRFAHDGACPSMNDVLRSVGLGHYSAGGSQHHYFVLETGEILATLTLTNGWVWVRTYLAARGSR